MHKVIIALLLSTLSFSSLAKTVKENEISRSQNVLALFNKACMEAYLDDEDLSNFLLNHDFQDLNEEKKLEKGEPKDTKALKEDAVSSENETTQSSFLGLSKTGKHYSIDYDNKRFFLDIGENNCSVLVQSINQDIFNSQIKEFKKSLTGSLFTETTKSFETRDNYINYKLTAYYYYTKDNDQQLPFELYLIQTNAKNTPYQLKLTFHIDKNFEKKKESRKKRTDKYLNAYYKY